MGTLLSSPITRHCVNGFVCRPSVCQSRFNCRDLQPSDFGPFSDTSSLPAVCQRMISSLVSVLLLFCCPLYVARFVVSVVIDAFNRMLWARTQAHILKKEIERTIPLRVNRNTPPSIVLINRDRRIVASFSHASPRLIFNRLGSTVASFTAPARHRATCTQCVGCGYNDIAAVAETPKCHASAYGVRFAPNGKFSETGSDWYIDFGWHVLSLLRLENLLARPAQSLQRLRGPFCILP